MKATSESISFRLSSEYIEELDRQIAEYQKRFGTEQSRGDFAKKVLIEYLTDTFRHESRAHMEETQASLQGLREDIATAMTSVLINVAKADPDQVKHWVRAALFHK